MEDNVSEFQLRTEVLLTALKLRSSGSSGPGPITLDNPQLCYAVIWWKVKSNYLVGNFFFCHLQ